MEKAVVRNNDEINIFLLRKNQRKLDEGLIAPAEKEIESVIAVDHSSDPIKSLDDIFKITSFLISNGRYRDNMLFIVGINFGLRVSDLRMLKFCDLINENFVFKNSFPVFEKKTRNTRKRKKNRYITINDAVMEAVTLYLQNTEGVCLSDYMFRSENKRGKDSGEPLTARAIEYILKGIAKECELDIHMATHTLRKTFCYHQMVMSNNDSRRLLLLQKMLNHSSPAQTLDYIGITEEEIEKAYKELNLGSQKYNYLMESDIVEANMQEEEIKAI